MLRLPAFDDAAIHMRIRLHGSRLTIDPPQHLAMIEVKRLSDGFVFKILHESGHESDNDEIVEVSLPLSAIDQWVELARANERVAGEGKKFPVISEVDVRNLPPEYKVSSSSPLSQFEFVTDQKFSIFLIGDEMVEEVIRAD